MGVTGDESEEEIAIQGIETMENFYHSIGMPINFHELGIHPNKQEIREMAEHCYTASGNHTGSAKELTVDDMVEIYLMANQTEYYIKE